MSTLYLDLDRTLFRTGEMERVWQEIERQFQGVDGRHQHEVRQQFYSYDKEGTYYHDMSAHLRSLGLDPRDVYDRLINSELADGSMMFDGAAELIKNFALRHEVGILTYGADDYQRFKAALCPVLREVPIVTTLSAKQDYLRHVSECWLVDDKPIGDELPAHVHFIQVSLEGAVIPPQPWPVCYSLAEVGKRLDEAMH